MPYIKTPDWDVVVKNKWLIFDADAVISIIEFKAENIFSLLKKLGSKFVYIHPVLLELMNTDRSTKKLQRSTLLAENEFLELPLRDEEMSLANRIQKSLPLGVKSKPSPTDFYLGATLAKYSKNERAFLLTSNVKDFPAPIFNRRAFLSLQNSTDVKTISILSIDMSKLLD